jgi:hypothetical protein
MPALSAQWRPKASANRPWPHYNWIRAHAMKIEQLYLSPGRNFFGRHQQPPGELPQIEQVELECVAGRGIRGTASSTTKSNTKVKSPSFLPRYSQRFARSYSETRVGVSRKHYSKVDATIGERRPCTKLTGPQELWFRSKRGRQIARRHKAQCHLGRRGLEFADRRGV